MSRSLRGLFRTVVVAFFVVAAPVLARAEETASALIARVEAKYKTVQTLKANVVQTTVNALGSETVAGELLLQRPAKMRWSFGDKLFVTNGDKMWIYTREDNQVIEYDDIASQRSTADSLLTSLDRLQELFEIKVLSSTSNGHQLELKPKKDAGFKKVQMYLDANLLVVSVVIVDAFDNVTNLALTGIQLNAPVDKASFEFSAPAGASIVKATTN
jgi:outer membrane lipoprotein carrier protein